MARLRKPGGGGAALAALTWTTITYGGSWRRLADSVDFEAQATKTAEGLVLLRGRVERITSVYTLPATIGTLAAAFRPPKALGLGIIRNMGAGGANLCVLLINTDGTLVVNSEAEVNAAAEVEAISDTFFLDNITFSTV